MTKIQLKRGLKENLPTLSVGEPAFATNTNELFIGSSTGNVSMTGVTQQWVEDYISQFDFNEEEDDMVNGQFINQYGWSPARYTVPCDGRILNKSEYVDANGQSLYNVVGKNVNIDDWIETADIYDLPSPTSSGNTLPGFVKRSNSSSTARIYGLGYGGVGYQETDTSQPIASFTTASGNLIATASASGLTYEAVTNGKYLAFLGSNYDAIYVSANGGLGGGNSAHAGLIKVNLPNASAIITSNSTFMLSRWGAIANDCLYTVAISKDSAEGAIYSLYKYDFTQRIWTDIIPLPVDLQNNIMAPDGLIAGTNGTHIAFRPKENTPATRICFFNTTTSKFVYVNLPDSPSGYNMGGTYHYLYSACTGDSSLPNGTIVGVGYKSTSPLTGAIWTITPGADADPSPTATVVNVTQSGIGVTLRDIVYTSTLKYITVSQETNGNFVFRASDTSSSAPTVVYTRASGTFNGNTISNGAILRTCPNANAVLFRISYSTGPTNGTAGVMGVMYGANRDVFITAVDDLKTQPYAPYPYYMSNSFFTVDSTSYYAILFNNGTETGSINYSSTIPRGGIFYIPVSSIGTVTDYSNWTFVPLPAMAFDGTNNVNLMVFNYTNSTTDGISLLSTPNSSIVEFDGTSDMIMRVAYQGFTTNTGFVQNSNGSLMVITPRDGQEQYGLLYSKDAGKNWRTLAYRGTIKTAACDSNVVRTTLSFTRNNSYPGTLLTDSAGSNIVFLRGTGGSYINIVVASSDMTTFTTKSFKITENEADAGSMVVGFAIDEASKKAYMLMPSGNLYVSSYTNTSPTAQEFDFKLDTVSKGISRLYTSKLQGASLPGNMLYLVKMSNGSTRLYAIYNTVWYKDVLDTKWTSLKLGIVAEPTNVNSTYSLQPNGSIFEICGAVAWSNTSNYFIVHDDINNVLNINFNRKYNASGSAIVAPDSLGRWMCIGDTARLYTMNNPPYDATTQFQMPTKRDTSIYWKP